MHKIQFSKEEKEQLIGRIKNYFNAELDQAIGGFEAEFLLDFFAAEIGAHFYNAGLRDANKLFGDKAEELGYLIQELEEPIN